MKMAATHEGFNLGIKVDYNSVGNAHKALNSLKSALSQVEKKANGIHMSGNLPREINHIDTVTASYIERLESEGKHYEANKEKVKAYQGAINELSEKQKSLQADLAKVASTAGKESDAFRTQKIKINENASELNHFRSGLKSTQEQMHQMHPGIWDTIKSKIHSTNQEASKTHTTFKSVFTGIVASNAVQNAFSSIWSGFKSSIHEGLELNAGLGRINATFKNMRLSSNSIKILDDQIGYLKKNVGLTGDQISGMQRQMINWSRIGKAGATEMTTAVAAIGAGSRMNTNDIAQMSGQLMRVGSTGKVTASSLSRITRHASTFYAMLAKGAGMSQTKLKATLATGKVTQKQFQGWLANSSKYASGVFKKYGETQTGALVRIHSAWQHIEQNMTKPLFNVKTSGMQDLATLMDSKPVQQGATLLGKALRYVANQAERALNFVVKHRSDVVGIGSDVVKIAGTLGKSVWKDFSDIALDIGKSLGLVSKNTKNDGLHSFKETMDGLAKNKQAIQVIARAIEVMAVAKLANTANSLLHITSFARGGLSAVVGLVKGFKGIQDFSKLSGAERVFAHIGSGAKSALHPIRTLTSAWSSFKGSKFFSIGSKINSGIVKGIKAGAHGIGKAGKWIGGKVSSGFKSAVHFTKAVGSKIGGIAKSVGSKALSAGKKIGHAISKGVKASTKFSMGKRLGVGAVAGAAVATPEVINAIKHRHSANQRSQDIGGAVGAMAGGTLTSMIPVVGPMLAPVGAIIGKYAGRWGGQAVNHFTQGWQRKKPPKHFWSLENLGYSAHNMWRGFTHGVSNTIRWFKKNWKEIGLYFVNPIAGGINSLYKHNKKFRGWVNGIARGFRHAWSSVKSSFRAFGRWFGRGWHNLFKGFNNNRYVRAFKKGQLFQTAFKDIRSRWNAFTKWLGKGWHNFWRGIGSWVKSIWHGITKNWNNFWGGISKKWTSFKSGFSKAWNGFWGGIGSFFKKIWKGIKTVYDNTIGVIAKGIGTVASGIGKVSGFLGKVGGGAKKAISHIFKTHANGGQIAQTHKALVGEAGPELAYKPFAKQARILGANGPQLTKVRSGEKILNAKDTRKVMSGGLGRGLVLNGYANGTAKLGQTRRSVSSNYKKIASDTSKQLKKVSKANSSTWSKVKSNATKQVRTLQSRNRSSWSRIARDTNKQTDKVRKNTVRDFTSMKSRVGKQTDQVRKNTVSDYTTMRSKVNKQMDYMQNGVVKTANSTSKGFGKAMDKMNGYAKDAMSDTIGQINKGIGGIDKVLSQFGGNGSVIKPVKFATGTDTNGRLTHDTLAMVNDAQHGPRQEAVVSDKNEVYLPHGNNVVMMLRKGWGVLNGTQTQMLKRPLQQPRHFAKGSGMSHSALRKYADKASANPAKNFADLFVSNLHVKDPNIRRGSVGLAKNSSTHYGDPWSNAMWSVIEDAIGGGEGKGGTREAFLKYAERTFTGVRYVMGAASHAASDCSGMVMQALKHFGLSAGRSTVDMQHSSELHYLGKNIHETIPGDLVIFGHGTGAAGHVGIIKNPRTGTMFNETPPHARVTRVADDESMGYGFYRVKGLHNASATKHVQKANKSLEALAKKELGAPALKWIKDKLGDEGSLGGNIGGEGVKRWAGTVKRILGMLHLSTSSSMVARVLRQINTESSGNPHARQPGADPDGDGSGPALGLMQTKRSTFEAFKRKGDHGGIFNGPSNIYAGLNYAKHRYGPSLSFLGNGHGYAKGGHLRSHTTALVGERGPELITPDGPVKIDSYDKTRRKFAKLGDLLKAPINRPAHLGSSAKAPVININLNGPIGNVHDAQKIANIIKREITKYFNQINDEFGVDPSLY